MMNRARHSERGSSVFTLIEILVVCAILVALAAVMIPRITGAGSGSAGAPPGKAASPIQRAAGVECQTNLTQIRAALTAYQTNNERYPASLQDLASQGVSAPMLACPVGGAQYAYGYDPAAGRVECRYPGHERY